MTRAVFMVMLVAIANVGWNPLHKDLTGQGNQAYQHEEYEQALEQYTVAQEHAPFAEELFINRGSTHYQLGEYDQALEAFNEALGARNPEIVAQAYYGLGSTQFKQAQRLFHAGGMEPKQYAGALEEAIKSYEQCLIYQPDDQDAKFNVEFLQRELKKLLEREEQDPQQQQQSEDGEPQPSDETESATDEDQSPRPAEQDDQQQDGEDEEEHQQAGDEDGTPTPQDAATQQDDTAATPAPEEEQETGHDFADGTPTPIPEMSPEDVQRILQQLDENPPRKPQHPRRKQVDMDW